MLKIFAGTKVEIVRTGSSRSGACSQALFRLVIFVLRLIGALFLPVAGWESVGDLVASAY